MYGFATVVTDQADYHPGSTVTITGGGWVPGESVALTLVESPLLDTHALEPVVADASGHIVSTQFVPDEGDVGVRFFLTATGSQSQAQTSFTDAASDTMTVNPTTLTAGATGKSLTFTFTSGNDYTDKDGKAKGQVTVVVPSGWTNPTGNTSYSKGTCEATPAQNTISGSGPWTILIDIGCSAMTYFTLTINAITAPSTVGTNQFTTQAGKTDKGGTVFSDVDSHPVVTVTAATATKLVITGSGTQSAGASQNLTITAKDAYGNTATGYTGAKNLTFSGASSSTNPVTAPTVKNSSGTAIAFGAATAITFTNGVATVSGGNNGVLALYKVETAVIAVSDGSISATGSDRLSVTVSGGTATKLVVTGSGTQAAGATQNLTVTASDAYGNTATSYTGSKNLTFSGANSSTSPVTAPTVKNSGGTAIAFGSTTAITFSSGVATVSAGNNGVMTLYKAEAAVIAVTDGSISATGSDRLSVAVSAGAMNKFLLSLTSPQTNGVAFTGTNTLTAQDAYGNTVTTFDASANNVTLAPVAPLTGAVSGLSGVNKLTSAGDFTSGVANLTTAGLKYIGTPATGTFTATAASGGHTGTSGSVTVNAGTQYATGTFTWDNGTTAKWSFTPGGPYTSVWATGNNAVLETTAGTVSIGAGGATASSITFNTTGFTVGSNTLTLIGPATVAAGTGISATIGSSLAGSAGLTKTGAGTLTLSGTNTYSGTTALDNGDGSDAGVLQISAASNLGNSTALNVTNGRLYATTSGISLGQTVTSNTPGGTTVQIDSGTLTFTSGWSGAGALYKEGAGTVVMNGAYTATGKPNINDGTLQLGSSGSISTTNMDVFAGGAFDFNGKNASFSTTVTLRGSGVGGGGALLNSAAATTSTLNGGAGITLGTNVSVGGVGNLVLPGIISGAKNLTKVGAGTLTLQGASIYSGNTSISAGTVALSSTGSIASSPLIDIAGGATYDVSAAAAATVGAGPSGPGRRFRRAAAPRAARSPRRQAMA
jgi:autotransporter-associated beta strand protein